MTSIYIQPDFGVEDKGDGGIRRVVEAQRKYLPALGVTIVDRADDADVLVGHGGASRSNTFKSRTLDRIPFVSHCHGLYWAEYHWDAWAHQLNRDVMEAIRQADVITAPSNWVGRAISRNTYRPVTVIHHGINVDEWAELEHKNKGYVLWNKTRVDSICDPWPMDQLAKLAPDTEFVSTFTKDPSNQGKNLFITGRLPFDHAKQWIADAGVYLATTRETFGIGTLEAMACGVPVLGFRWGGQQEIVTHGIDGWLVNPGDIAGLEQGLRYIQKNRDAMGEAARQKVMGQFTWDRIIPKYAELYRSLGDYRDYVQKLDIESNRPTVSVVVTCYNLARYMEQCINSIHRQTMTDWELILVDDASTDNGETARICRQAEALDSRIRVVTNSKNLYLAGARNAGIEQARGQYILPLDADDQLMPNTLEVLSGELDKYRDIDIAYGACVFFDEPVDGPVLDPGSESVAKYQSGWPQDFDYHKQMAHRNQLPYSSMFRRKVWSQTGGYRVRNRTAEDAEFWCRVTSQGYVAKKVTDAMTLVYRNRQDSMSHIIPDPDWTAWFPWSRHQYLTPAIVAAPTTSGPVSWPIPSFEPVHVAVIIPCGPGHIGKVIDAIDSVDAQTFRNWEIVVANDTQYSNERFIELAHIPAYVRVVMSGGHSIANARNAAISAAIAPLIVPLDADDYLQPDALDRLVSSYRSQLTIVTEAALLDIDKETPTVLKSRIEIVVYPDWLMDKGDGNKPEVKECSDWDATLITRRAIHPVTCIFSKSAWSLVGGYDPNAPGWEDWDFELALASKGICSYRLPLPLMTYRMHTGNRREESIGDRDSNIQWITDKYKGVNIPMACRCGSGKVGHSSWSSESGQSQSMAQQLSSMQSGEGTDLVMVQYSGKASGFNVVGKSTGIRYKFGNDSQHQAKFVAAADVEFLLTVKDFSLVPQDREGEADRQFSGITSPVLVAG